MVYNEKFNLAPRKNVSYGGFCVSFLRLGQFFLRKLLCTVTMRAGKIPTVPPKKGGKSPEFPDTQGLSSY